MTDALQTPRSRIRTACLVAAPSGILVIGVCLSFVAAIGLAENPFRPNLIIMMCGVVVVVPLALLTVFRLNRTGETTDDKDPPKREA